MKDAHAVVVLPPGAYGHLADKRQCRWLSRGSVSFGRPNEELLLAVLDAIDAPVPAGGLAALRFWGQTGERSNAWIAAADPVHFETRLRHLVVREILPGEVGLDELRALFDTLQHELANDDIDFARLGSYGYLRGCDSIDTPTVSAAIAHGRVPDEFTPGGQSAGVYHNLQGELQMLLHDHPVNMQRSAAGMPAINSLWFWGGGIAPEEIVHEIPMLFANDPLYAGYWASVSGQVERWDGDFATCLERSTGSLVAVLPQASRADNAVLLKDCVDQLLRHLKRRELDRLTLFFRDGLRIDMRRRDLLKIWRGVSPFLTEQVING